MNYCIVAFAIVLMVSVIQWYVDGKKNYKGPSIDMKAMHQGEVMGMAVEGQESKSETEDSENTTKDDRVV